MSVLSVFLGSVLVGLAGIIPGMSGAMMMVSTGLHETYIRVIGDTFKRPFHTIFQNAPLYTGTLAGVLIGAWTINRFYVTHRSLMLSVFAGIVLGTLPSLGQKTFKGTSRIRLSVMCVIFFFVPLVLRMVPGQGDVTTLPVMALSGLMSAFAALVPGISAATVMLAFGVLGTVTAFPSTVSDIILGHMPFDTAAMVPSVVFAVCALLGLHVGSWVVNRLMSLDRASVMAAILGLSAGTVAVLFSDILAEIGRTVDTGPGLTLLGHLLPMMAACFLTWYPKFRQKRKETSR